MKRRFFTICLIIRIIVMPCLLKAAEPPLCYQPTGSTPLHYQTHFREKEEITAATSFIRFDQEKLEEKKEHQTRERRLVLNKSVRRETAEDKPDLLSTRISSIIESEDSGKDQTPLPSQRIAEFSESVDGVNPESYALEALAYFGIPLSLSVREPAVGQDWQKSWSLRPDEGPEISFAGHYRIDRIGLLAGHWCAFVSYDLKEEGSEWEGQGSFAFDIRQGVLVAHQGRLLRTRETEEFQESSRIHRKRESLYEIAEVLVP